VEAESIYDASRHAIKIIKNRKLHYGMAQTEVKILKLIIERDPNDKTNIGKSVIAF
jgi:hypothetical protein